MNAWKGKLEVSSFLPSNGSCYQKSIGTEFTHLNIPSLCKEFFVMRHNIGHSNASPQLQSTPLNLLYYSAHHHLELSEVHTTNVHKPGS